MKGLFLCLFMSCSVTAIGQQYFQQKVDTRLDVRLDDKTHFLHGTEEFTYTNNSPDTLRFIYIHLYPNAYLNDRTAFTDQKVLQHNSDFYYAKEQERGYIDSLNPFIDGSSVSIYSSYNTPDVGRIDLPKPLLPGGSFNLSTTFRVKIPKLFSRLGHKKQAYCISQWFPKPAVYDTRGWHPMPYLDQGEFYSEIGSYDVKITLPKNYVVMATGNCLDEEENAWLDSLSGIDLHLKNKWYEYSQHVTDSLNAFPKSSETMKTIHFQEDNIHDFAWFADKRYIVRKEMVKIEGREDSVAAYAAFLPASKNSWRDALSYIKETVQTLSKEVGIYPYKTVKAVQGDMKAGGGMEYPTVTIIDNTITSGLLKMVIAHEVGHNWFYGILASNERDVPWMDEGINSFYENKIAGDDAGSEKVKLKTGPIDLKDELLYYQALANNIDQPLNLPSTAYTELNYGGDIYKKSALMLQWLEAYMGAESFKAAMRDYFDSWKHKHPYPEDFRTAMEKHTTKPVNWFFDGGLTTDRKIDFKIKNVRTTGNETSVTIINRSDIVAPVGINAYRNDSLIETIWTQPFEKREQVTFKEPGATLWSVTNTIPDLKTTNNSYSKNGLFHGRGLAVGFGYGIRRDDKSRINLLPAIGYNVYNGFMAGLIIHNLSIPDKNFRFAIAPVYGTRSGDFGGAGSVGYFIHPKSLFREVVVQLDAKRFGYDKTNHNIDKTLYANYLKLAPSVSFVFKNASLNSQVTRTLMLKGYSIKEEYFDFQKTAPDTLFRPQMASQQGTYALLRYTHRNDRLFNPFSYNGEVQMSKDFVKIGVEGNARIDYNKKSKSLYLRGFLGKFINMASDEFSTSRYWLNTTYTGVNDYLYDDTYFGRNEREGIAYHQVSMREGGAKIPTAFYASPLGRSDDLLGALNIKTDLPFGRLPLRLYLDISTFSNAKQLNPSGNRFLYSGGAELHFMKDILQINIPLVLSKDYTDYLNSIYVKDKFLNRISFTLNLQNINWLKTSQGVLNSLSK